MVLYIYNGILATKKKEIPTFATTWMDLKGIVLSEVSQARVRLILHELTYRWNLKKQTTKNHQTHSKRGQIHGYQRQNWMKVVKRHKISVLRYMSARNVTYNVMTNT